VSDDLYPWNYALWRSLGLPERPPPAALLLAGPNGVGKGQFATHLVRALLCPEPKPDGQACGQCRSCRLYEAGNHPDFRRLQDSASDEEEGASVEEDGDKGRSSRASRWIRVDQVRELGDFLALRAHLAFRRAVLIQPADRLHGSAANALLKTLEEPPSQTHFILVTDNPMRLPATVLSRCMRLQFALPAQDQAVSWLEAQGCTNAPLALAQAGFAPLRARELDVPDYWSRRDGLIRRVLAAADFDPVAVSERITSEELAFLVGSLQRWCYDLALVRSARAIRYNPDCAQILHQLAAGPGLQRLLRYLRRLQSTARFLDHPLNPRLVAEQCLIEYRRALQHSEP
jgi:DNA polymerase-3 subunit delta'